MSADVQPPPSVPADDRPLGKPRRAGAAAQFGVGFVLIVAAWMLGVVARVAQRPAPSLPPSDVVPPAQFEQLYGEAWDYVNSEFYGDRPAPAAITDGAVEGMVEALDDPWALVATPAAGVEAVSPPSTPPSEPGSEADPLAPTYLAELGMWVADTSRGARVLAVAPEDGPAAAAGIEAGDLIVRAENSAGADAPPTATAAATADPAAPEHDPVTSGDRLAPIIVSLSDRSLPAVDVVVARDETSLFARSLTRAAAAEAPSAASAERKGRVLHVRLAHLGAGAAAALDAALSGAGNDTSDAADAADAPSAIVLDLRDNPGGSRTELAAVAGHFMSGVVWIERSRDGTETEHPALSPNGGADLTAGDVIVLVNGGTGDEAEMLAAALRDARGARLVGEATYGHGTLQTLVSIGRLQLRLTTGTWRSPGAADVTEAGLAPDVVVEGRSEQDAAAEALTRGAAEAHAADGGG